MSVEKANNLLQQARGLDATGYNLEMALGCRLEAVVVAITALIERLDEVKPPAPPKPVTCRLCFGHGHAWGPDSSKLCPACGGRGTL